MREKRLEQIKLFEKLTVYILLLIPIYAYMTFYFVYPVVGVFPLGPPTYMLILYVFYSILLAMVVGIFVGYPQKATSVVVISAIFGYILSLVYLAFPAIMYGYSIYVSDLIVLQYTQYSFLLLIIYVVFGIMGVFLGDYLRERLFDFLYS